MGSYNSVYVGVYVEIPHVKSTITIKYLANPNNGKSVKYKFHPETGVESIPKERTEGCWLEPETYDIEGLPEDAFFEPAYAGPARSSTFFDSDFGKTLSSDELKNVDLSRVNMGEKIQEFKDKYLSHLKKANKDFEINIKFGVVYYAH